MNNYPIWWSDTITVYNKFENNQTQLVKWYRTVIDGVFWKNRGSLLEINGVGIDTNSIICRIRKDPNYISKADWIQLPNDEMAQYFTLFNGDIVIKGNVEDEIDEYKQGQRSSDLLNKYKAIGECFVIEQVTDNTGIGRGQEHYYIVGK